MCERCAGLTISPGESETSIIKGKGVTDYGEFKVEGIMRLAIFKSPNFSRCVIEKLARRGGGIATYKSCRTCWMEFVEISVTK
jgi:hypothetical protein